MELGHIRSFLEIVRSGSVTRAAAELALTQPAVTQHIQSLEREFNAVLFDRTGKGMRLTQAGRVLQKHFEQALASLGKAKSAVEETESGVVGHLTIGTALTMTRTGIAACISQLRKTHPGISLTVRVARSEIIISLILDGQLELGIAAVASRPSGLRLVPLFEQTFTLVAPADHPLGGRLISKRQAATLQMIDCSPGPWIGMETDLTTSRAAVAKIETETLDGIKALVEAGLGCAILPTHDVAEELAHGRFSQIRVRGLAMPLRSICLVQRKDTSCGAGARALIQLMRQHYASHPLV
jgi:LysR family transcriptional regulator, transcriptional activator of the cysJI operon